MPAEGNQYIRVPILKELHFVNAALCYKMSFPIVPDPTDDVFPTAPPLVLTRYRGEYSWFEVVENVDGKWLEKPNGLFGVAGGTNAAHEINRSNANVHLQHMRVRLWKGHPDQRQVSDNEDSLDCSTEGSPNKPSLVWWFDLNLPREDGPTARRYIISHVAGNEPIEP